jgi:ElaB/YqjD/DUF883 family membrane-anchored ribosome-binding protein
MAMNNFNLPDNETSRAITRQQLVADFNLVLSDIEALIRATANQRGAEIAKVRSKAADTVAAMKTRVAGAEVALLSKARQASKIADDYVRESPWRNLGIAAGVGLLIGLLIGRR